MERTRYMAGHPHLSRRIDIAVAYCRLARDRR
jgi:hypothetical protein